MDFTTILSSATKFKKTSLYKTIIADNTKQLLYRINSGIMNAHDAGLTKVDVELPINFKKIDENIPNAELQTSIYYNIVQELERMGYVAKLKFQKDVTILRVSWTVRASSDLLDEMKSKLMSITF